VCDIRFIFSKQAMYGQTLDRHLLTTSYSRGWQAAGPVVPPVLGQELNASEPLAGARKRTTIKTVCIEMRQV